MEKKGLKGIVAVNNLGFIGKGVNMLWRCPEDLKMFFHMTKGQTLLVGYNTLQGLPPLKGRTIIQDLRNKLIVNPGEIDWCIGGKKTYQKYCHLFTELHISHINNDDIGDVTFPDLTNLNPDCKIFNYYYKSLAV